MLRFFAAAILGVLVLGLFLFLDGRLSVNHFASHPGKAFSLLLRSLQPVLVLRSSAFILLCSLSNLDLQFLKVNISFEN